MFGLKSLPKNIEHRSFQGIKTSNFFNLPKTRLKVLIHHLIGSSKDLHIEKDDSFDSQFFWCQNVEKEIQTVTFIELVDLIDKLIGHGKR